MINIWAESLPRYSEAFKHWNCTELTQLDGNLFRGTLQYSNTRTVQSWHSWIEGTKIDDNL